MPGKQWQAMLDVHVTAPFKLIQAVTPLMREAAKQEQAANGEATPRSIINISSTSGTHGKIWYLSCCMPRVATASRAMHGATVVASIICKLLRAAVLSSCVRS